MTESLDRRRFLQALAAISAAPLASLANGSDAAADGGGRGRRVVVLGAGLAGLGAAYNLMRHGYDVTVLEAQSRPGGRVETVRAGLQRGGHAEMGAIRILASHEHTLRYVRELGLELTPYDEGARAFHLQGKRFLPPLPGRPWPLDGFAPGEQPDPAARFGDYLGSAFARLGDVFDPGWPGAFPSALELDRTTVEGYMGSQGASVTWRDWFFAQEGRIARVNAAELGQRVKYCSEVVRIAQDREHLTVGFRDRGGLQEIRADRQASSRRRDLSARARGAALDHLCLFWGLF